MKNLRKFFILFSLCLFLIMAWESKGVQKQETREPQDRTITITVRHDNVICTPNSQPAFLHENVKWISDYAFAVDFGLKAPFNKKQFRAKKKDAQQGKGGRVTYEFTGAPNTLKRKEFKYFVAVFYEEEILTADPNLVIRR